MRQDRVSHYGHDRPTTPHLDELAERSTVYENAITPTPWTLPTHCSLFSGLFPSEHGVTNGTPGNGLQLSRNVETLPERLADRGYRTASFVNNPWVGETSDLQRGFDEYFEWDLEISRHSGELELETADKIYSKLHSLIGHSVRHPLYLVKRRFFTNKMVDWTVRWIENSGNCPTFTFMNLMEAHSPYFPPTDSFQALNLDPPGPLESRILNMKLSGYLLGHVDPESIRSRILEYYDASLRYQDREVGRILQAIRDEDKLNDTLIVICADHGKTLGEYDRQGTPSHYLRDVNTDVPLLVKEPGQREPVRVSEPVELVNLFEFTLGESRESPRSYQPLDNVALFEDHLPHTSGEETAITRWRGICTADHKYVRNGTGEEYVFDRKGDPETHVESPSEGRLEECRQLLEDRVSTLAVGTLESSDDNNVEELGSEKKNQLKSLGYL